MNRFTHDGFGMGLGDFFDIHSTRRAGHENDFPDTAIDENTEIQFALDVQAFFNENALDGTAAGTSLRGDEICAQHMRGDFRSFVRRVRELDAARLAAATSVDLRFYYDYVGL